MSIFAKIMLTMLTVGAPALLIGGILISDDWDSSVGNILLTAGIILTGIPVAVGIIYCFYLVIAGIWSA